MSIKKLHSKFVAHQGDLFADAQYWAQLEEKFPYLRAVEGAASNGARPQRSEDAAPGDAGALLGAASPRLLTGGESLGKASFEDLKDFCEF